MLKTLGALLAAILSMRCATAIHGRYQSVPVASVPPGASIAVACDRYRVDAGVTPANVVLPRAAEGCSVTLTKPGYDQARVWFERVPSGARFVNLVPAIPLSFLCGLLGFALNFDRGPIDPMVASAAGGYVCARAPFVIDDAAGGAYTQVPEKVEVTLSPPGKSASPARTPRS
jgi:hypothetical protein